jgi:hypothetical protein
MKPNPETKFPTRSGLNKNQEKRTRIKNKRRDFIIKPSSNRTAHRKARSAEISVGSMNRRLSEGRSPEILMRKSKEHGAGTNPKHKTKFQPEAVFDLYSLSEAV